MLPIMRFKVEDKSMEPNFMEGDYVLVNRLAPNLKEGDAIVIKPDEIFMIKRIVKINDGRYMVQGDNKKYSSPIAVKKDQIIGKVFFRIRH